MMHNHSLTAISAAVLLAVSGSLVQAADGIDLTGRESIAVEKDQTWTEDLDIDGDVGLNYKDQDDLYVFGIISEDYEADFIGRKNVIKVDSTDQHFPDFPDTTPGAIGIDARSGASICISGENATHDITVTSDKYAVGARATQTNGEQKETRGGQVTFTGKSLTINVQTTGKVEGAYAYGLHAQNRTTGHPDMDMRAKLIVETDNAHIVAKAENGARAAGLVVTSQGWMEVKSNVTVEAADAVLARGDSILRVNPDEKHSTRFIGNVHFAYDKNSTLDSEVDLHFVGPDSYWKGNAIISYEDTPSATEDIKVTGFSVTLKDGAAWYLTPAISDQPKMLSVSADQAEQGVTTAEPLAINHMTLSNGNIHIPNVTQTVTINEMSGTGGTVHVATRVKEGGFETAKLSIGAVAEGSKPVMTAVYDGIDSDKYRTAADFDKLKKAGAIQGNAVVSQVHMIPEGDIYGAAVDDGSGIRMQANTKQDAYRSLSAMNAMAWRHDMNDLTKRMGELRDSPAGIGSWVRIYGSEQEYGEKNLTAKNTSIQVGTDFPVGDEWKVGAAFTYTDGDTDYEGGSAESDSYSGAIYGSWLSESGQFVDLIAKYTRMSSDFSLNGFNGSQDNDALSVSAEYGWHLKINDQFFVEPQAELTYGRVFGDTFDGEANKAMTIDQDDFDSLIGRIGIRTGFYFPDNKGTLYARVSGVYDFLGEFEYTAVNSDVRHTFKDDLGGAWIEYAVGANLNWTENTYTYIDLERTSGGEVPENYRWNIGLRHVW